ncbi:MAG TPA: hypothetical protein VFZ48_04590 [Candidatus Saccharimonadales bacterium]
MATHYLERRSLRKPTPTLAADIAKHLQLRQRLGTSVIVCENPHALLSATRKQWLRLSRQLQIQRAATLNTEEILRLTHIIVHMQKMLFVAKTPELRPGAHVYYVTPQELTTLPPQCFSLYITTAVVEPLEASLASLANLGVVVDYTCRLTIDTPLLPKEQLEEDLGVRWQNMANLLERYDIKPQLLISQDARLLPLLDTAVDTLLEAHTEFLHAAFELQHAIDLAQPLTTVPPEQQKLFTTITRLAYKVQTLTSRSSLSPLLTDSFFLRDKQAEYREQAYTSAFRVPLSLFRLIY